MTCLSHTHPSQTTSRACTMVRTVLHMVLTVIARRRLGNVCLFVESDHAKILDVRGGVWGGNIF